MELFAGKRPKQQILDQDRLKTEYRPYIVSGSRAALLIFSDGRILSQVMDGSGFRIWFHDFFIRGAFTLSSFTEYRLSILHYALFGGLYWKPRGECKMELEEGRYYLLDMLPGREYFIFLRPGVTRVFQIDFPEVASSGLMTDVVREDMIPYTRPGIPNAVMSSGINDFRVKTVIDNIRMCNIADHRELSYFLSGRVMDILQLHARQRATRKQHPPQEETIGQKMEAVKDYILAHLEHPLPFATLSQQFHISESALKRHFKRYAQQTVHAYINEQRMEYAVLLLRDRQKQVSEVALLTGFEDISGFRRAFKKHFGISPSQFAKPRYDRNSTKINKNRPFWSP